MVVISGRALYATLNDVLINGNEAKTDIDIYYATKIRLMRPDLVNYNDIYVSVAGYTIIDSSNGSMLAVSGTDVIEVRSTSVNIRQPLNMNSNSITYVDSITLNSVADSVIASSGELYFSSDNSSMAYKDASGDTQYLINHNDLYNNKEYYFHTLFESINGLISYVTGSGSLVNYNSSIKMETGLTAGSYASLILLKDYPTKTHSWANKRNIKSKIYIDVGTDKEALVGCGDVEGGVGYGFKVSGGDLYAYNSDGTGSQSISIQTGFVSGAYLFEIKYIPSTGIYFYVDGVLKQTTTTLLPSGTTDANILFDIYVKNLLATTNAKAYFSELDYWED